MNRIPGFPVTAQDIQSKSSEELNALLGELGLGFDGKKALKQQRLSVHIGLRANPA
jgi:hypothetical protein